VSEIEDAVDEIAAIQRALWSAPSG
jgi:hypothetical protein